MASKKLILVLAVAMYFSLCHFASANVVISEIFYSTASKQWVEIYNDTASDIDITQYKILDAGAAVNGHSITSASTGGPSIIPAHGYGVIAKDITSVTATNLFHAALGMSTGGDTITLKNAGIVVDTATFSNTAAVGESLQLINNAWVSAAITPGAANQADAVPATPTGPVGNGGLVADYSDSATTSTTTNTNKTPPAPAKIKVDLDANTFAFVGVPLSMQATAYGTEGEHLNFGKYFWNFGDGDSKEIEASDNQKFTHIYYYPGTYTVSLDYYSNNYSDTADASDELTIKVVPVDLTISKVGDDKDFFVELTNNSSYAVDISGYILTSSTKSFVLPRDTFISAKSKMMISGRVTGLLVADKDSLRLLDPSGETVFDLSAPVPDATETAETTATDPAPVTVSASVAPIKKADSADQEFPAVKSAASDSIPTQTVALAIKSNTEPKGSDKAIIPVIFVILLASAGGVAYFIRHKRPLLKDGTDFEILDE